MLNLKYYLHNIKLLLNIGILNKKCYSHAQGVYLASKVIIKVLLLISRKFIMQYRYLFN